MLKVNNIKKEFKKSISKKKQITFYADNNISFEAKPGEIIGILGPNGAGKTTLLRIIAGIMEPSEGNITIDEKDYKNNSIEIKKEIAYLSGNTKLYKDISPYELLEMCGNYYQVPKDKLNARINMIVKKFDMESFVHQKIENLSTGQYQRTNIARVLIHDPKYYILDEVTSGLDVISSQVILEFVKEERNRKKCILYSTHYMEEAESLSDRIGIMANGNIVEVGTSKELINKTKAKNFEDAFVSIATGGEL